MDIDMKRANNRLRLRLSAVESQLREIESPPPNRRLSDRLKEDRQRQLLKEQITIEEALELIVYPILTLPVELTSEIFFHCIEPVPSVRVAPMLLGRICREWRLIAYDDPRLWSSLSIAEPAWYRFGLEALIGDWVLRAGSVPLSFRMTLPSGRCAGSFFTRTCGCPSSRPVESHWEHLTRFHGDNFTVLECIQVLLRVTQLVRCEFESIVSSEAYPAAAVTRPERPRLTHLTLSSAVELSKAFRILDSLASPGLASLTVVVATSFSGNNSLLLSFLERTPTIESFSIRHVSGDIPSADFIPILDALPALTSLSVFFKSETVLFDILRRLYDPSTAFMPCINSLTFSASRTFCWKAEFNTIITDALASRSEPKSETARLATLDLDFPLARLDDKVTKQVSELKEKGMLIRLGPKPAVPLNSVEA
ncbi:hypothetical protein C8R47DRAFT_1051286 [Mycena vitilis]|nr:hypothetical protein C8R47DRAFT_1051286 [Mycena vitilis]